MIIIAVISLSISITALFFSWRADKRQKQAQEREEKSSKLQIKPVIQSRLITVDIGSEFASLTIEINNPSGYDAFDLTVDVKFGDNDWISEWLKANNQPPKEIQRLFSGDFLLSFLTGALPKIKNDKILFDIHVRTKWRNEFRQHFETFMKYQLNCTTVGTNKSYTFIPQEMPSHV